MKYILVTGAIATLAIAFAGFAGDAGQGKGGSGGDRMQQTEQQKGYEQDRLHSRVETQDRVTMRNEEIYGHELMSKQEMNQYRDQLSKMKTENARAQFQREHEEKMRQRALQQNMDIVPPGQGPVYRGELMTVQERNAYREQLRNMKSEEERARFTAQHRAKMDERARAMAKETEEAE